MFISPTTIDENILNWVVENRSEHWVSIAEVVTVLGNTVTMLVLTCAVVVTLAVTRHRVDAVFVGAGVLFGYGLMQALKYSFARDRPPVEDRLLNIDTFSFPSGHAANAVLMWGVARWQAVEYGLPLRVQHVFWWLSVVGPVATGVAMVSLDFHWVADAVVGAAVGIVLLGVVHALDELVLSRWVRARAGRPGS